MPIPASILTFPVSTDPVDDGAYAERDADGNLRHVGLYQQGRLRLGLDLTGDDQAHVAENRHFAWDEGRAHVEPDPRDPLLPTMTPEAVEALSAERYLALARRQSFVAFVRDELDAIESKVRGIPRCGFCGKANHEVERLIAGPRYCICNECIDLCNDILGTEV